MCVCVCVCVCVCCVCVCVGVCVCVCVCEWLVLFDQTEGKRGLTLGVMFHSMQRLLHFVT